MNIQESARMRVVPPRIDAYTLAAKTILALIKNTWMYFL